MKNALIIDAVRTPRGRGKPKEGGLSNVHPQELAAQCLGELTRRTGIDPVDVGGVTLGASTQVDEQCGSLARGALLSAGWPTSVPGMTVNCFCGSGLQAVVQAAQAVESGMVPLAVGGGAESMSRVTIGSDTPRISQFPPGADVSPLDGRNLRLREKHPMLIMGVCADVIATREGFTRGDLDAFALESQQRAARAAEAGHFASIIPARDPASGAVLLERDEAIRGNTSLEKLGQLRPAFEEVGATPQGASGETLVELAMRGTGLPRIEHVHTAGNSSGIVDGAAAVLVASTDYAKSHGLRARGRIRAVSLIGSDPLVMLTGPAEASRRALREAGMGVGDVELWEINEAFAAVPLQTMRELELDPERVNVNGGAIAMGHPLGATGAILLGTALDELERSDRSTALVTLCIATGMAIAMIVERC